jgi:predicted enzyme related to lactoylglutathione lyase
MLIERITLAATRLDSTVAFYNAVFDSNLQPVPGMPLYAGTLLGLDLLVCDNAVARVDARQNRHQFRVAVPDLDALRATVEAAGGTVINAGADSGRPILGVRDPDGNTYEFIAARAI